MNNKMKTVEDYLAAPYSRVFIPEDEGYSASVLEFPGCYSFGDTLAEAAANLEEVAKSWLETTIYQGHPIPEPIAEQEYSGRIALRLPKGLHQRAAQMAERDQTSLNTLIVSAVAEKVGAAETRTKMAELIDSILEKRLSQRRWTSSESYDARLISEDFNKLFEQKAAGTNAEPREGISGLIVRQLLGKWR